MVNLLKQHPQNYLLKKYFDGQEYPGDNYFEYITLNNHLHQLNEDSTSIFEGNVTIHGDLIVNSDIESELNKIQQRYLTIYEPNEIEQQTDTNETGQLTYTVEDEVPSGTIDSSNDDFTLQNTNIKANSVEIFVDGDTDQVTDDGSNNLVYDESTIGSIDYSTGQITLTSLIPTSSLVQNYQYEETWLVNGSNTVFKLTKTPIKPFTVFIYINGDELIITNDERTDQTTGTLSDGGTINYSTGEIDLDVQPQSESTISVNYTYYISMASESTEGLFNGVPTQGLIVNRGQTPSWDKKLLWDEKPQNSGTNYFSFVQNDETTPEYLYFKFDQLSPLYPQFDSLFLSQVNDDTFLGNMLIEQDLTVNGTIHNGTQNLEQGETGNTFNENTYINYYNSDYQLEIVDGDINVQNNISIGGSTTQVYMDVDEIDVNILTIGDTLTVASLTVTDTTELNGNITTNKKTGSDNLFDVNHDEQHFHNDVRIDGTLYLNQIDSPEDWPFVLNSGDTVNGQLILNKQGDANQLLVNDQSVFETTQTFNSVTTENSIVVNGEQEFNDAVTVNDTLTSQGLFQQDSSDSQVWNLTINNTLDISGVTTIHDDLLPSDNLSYNIGSDTARLNIVYQDVFDGNITNQIFQDVQENIYQNDELEQGDICELIEGKLVKQNNKEQNKLYIISENPQVHLQTDRENSYPVQLQGSVKVKLDVESKDNVKLGDEIVLSNNGIGKIKTNNDSNYYILGQVIEIKNDNIVILLY